MIEAILRPAYQQIFVDPVLGKFNHLQPIQITIISGLLGFFFIPSLLLGYNVLAFIFLLGSGYCDTLDGSLARYQHTSSAIGSTADIVTDRLVEFAIIFAFYLQNPGHRSLAIVFMLGSILFCVTSFLVVGIFTTNQSSKSFHYSPGLIERAEAFIFFALMIFLPGYFNILALIFVILVFFTALVRLSQFVHMQQES